MWQLDTIECNRFGTNRHYFCLLHPHTPSKLNRIFCRLMHFLKSVFGLDTNCVVSIRFISDSHKRLKAAWRCFQPAAELIYRRANLIFNLRFCTFPAWHSCGRKLVILVTWSCFSCAFWTFPL